MPRRTSATGRAISERASSKASARTRPRKAAAERRKDRGSITNATRTMSAVTPVTAASVSACQSVSARAFTMAGAARRCIQTPRSGEPAHPVRVRQVEGHRDREGGEPEAEGGQRDRRRPGEVEDPRPIGPDEPKTDQPVARPGQQERRRQQQERRDKQREWQLEAQVEGEGRERAAAGDEGGRDAGRGRVRRRRHRSLRAPEDGQPERRQHRKERRAGGQHDRGQDHAPHPGEGLRAKPAKDEARDRRGRDRVARQGDDRDAPRDRQHGDRGHGGAQILGRDRDGHAPSRGAGAESRLRPRRVRRERRGDARRRARSAAQRSSVSSVA